MATDAAAGQRSLVVKCRLDKPPGHETRAFELLRPSLAELRRKLAWLFDLRCDFSLAYLDKYGDLVTFSTDEEFRLAMENYLRPEMKVKVMPAHSAHLVERRGFTDDGFGFHELPQQRLEQQRLEQQRLEQQRLEQQRLEQQRLEQQRLEQQRLEQQRLEQQHLQYKQLQQHETWDAMFHPHYLQPRICARPKRPAAVRARTPLAWYGRPPNQQQAGDFVHHGLSCVGCGASPLVGWRYKCSVCPDYNVCAQCFGAYSHGHGFFRLP